MLSHMFFFYAHDTYSTCTCHCTTHVPYVTRATGVRFGLHEAPALLRGDVFSFFFTFRKTVVCPPCSGLVGVLQSEERPDGQLMLYAGVVEQGLLLQLLQLLGVEAERMRPQISPCVDERGAQRFCKRTVNLLFPAAVDPCVIAWHTHNTV